MSQLYSNMFPLVLLVLGIALAAWSIAGSESEGTLEMLLANPVSRVSAAVGRVAGMWLLVALVTVVGTAVLAATSPPVGLDEGLPWWGLWSAGVATYALVMVQASLGFAVGAATGSKGAAIAAATVFAVLGFVAQLVGSAADALSWLRDLSPWYWLMNSNPLTEAPGMLNTVLPLGLALVFTTVGIAVFDRRDVTA
jgi:ABC-2 type transport system permease protein